MAKTSAKRAAVEALVASHDPGDMILPAVAILPSGLTLVPGIGVVFVVLVEFLVLIPEFSS